MDMNPYGVHSEVYGGGSLVGSRGCYEMGDNIPLPMKKGFGSTDRIDAWWKGPSAMAFYLGIMVVYATWRGFMEADFWIFEAFGRSAGNQTMAIERNGSHVLSPLFSHLIIPDEHSWMPEAMWWLSPAMFIVWPVTSTSPRPRAPSPPT